MDKPKIVGDIVGTWKKFADGRSTIVYAAGVEASLHLRDAFRVAGVDAEHVDADSASTVAGTSSDGSGTAIFPSSVTSNCSRMGLTSHACRAFRWRGQRRVLHSISR